MGFFKALKTAYRVSTFTIKVWGNLILGSLNAFANTMETTANVLDDVANKRFDVAANRIENKICNMGRNLGHAIDCSCQFLDEISQEKSVDKIFSNKNVTKASQLVLIGCGVLYGIDALDGDENEGVNNQHQISTIIPHVLDTNAIQNGMFIGNESDLNALILAGEAPNSVHIDSEDTERSLSVKQAFLEMHGYDSVPEGYEVHHIMPLSEGGSDSIENLLLVSEEDHEKITAAHRQFYGWNS